MRLGEILNYKNTENVRFLPFLLYREKYEFA